MTMRYEGPIYRPPSEADSLLIQATVGCPHNKCTFCMVYKDGPPFRVRSVEDICEDMDSAALQYGRHVTTLFFPAGNTIAMKTEPLSRICRYAYSVFPNLQRVTVYGSSQYIHQKGLSNMKLLAEAGLSRIHVGLESGDDMVLSHVCKGTNRQQQIEAGQLVMEAGIELSLYVLLGLGGRERSLEHARQTTAALNAINPTFIRLRTLLPKRNTPLLDEIVAEKFQVLGPHEVLRETWEIVNGLNVSSELTSDHYTNYINVCGMFPQDKPRILQEIESAMKRDASTFRPIYIGNQ